MPVCPYARMPVCPYARMPVKSNVNMSGMVFVNVIHNNNAK
jgi:hypothetical protein